MLIGPELISNTYLALFLKQLQQEGYSIFVVVGSLPQCASDQVLANTLISQTQKPKLLSETAFNGSSKIDSFATEMPFERIMNDQKNLQDVIQMSLDMSEDQANEDLDLELAIALSMNNDDAAKKEEPMASTSSFSSSSSRPAILSEQDFEEEQLQRALKISLEQFDRPSP